MRALIADVLAGDGHAVKRVAHGADALVLLVRPFSGTVMAV
jgi:hypothetical protein